MASIGIHFRKIMALLSKRERRQLCWLSVATLLMASMDVVGVVSILPFLAVLANPDIIAQNAALGWLYRALRFEDREAFVLFLGVVVFASLVCSNVCRALTTWAIVRFAQMREYTISKRFLVGYVGRPYLFFTSRNSSELSKNILSEISTMINGVLMPAMEAVARAVLVVMLAGMLVYANPALALLMCVLIGGMYAGIYGLAQRRLFRLSNLRSQANRRRFQSISELFGGIKDVKLLGREGMFVQRYASSMVDFSESQVSCMNIAQMPKFALEVVVFGGILALVLYCLVVRRDMTQMLPLLGLYVLAGYRIMPSLQAIFHSVTRIKFYIPSVDMLYADLEKEGGAGVAAAGVLKAPLAAGDALAFSSAIELEKVRFSYPGVERDVLDGISLSIPRNTTVAFVGSTGSGKTTMVDIIMALMEPSSGALKVDGVAIDSGNRRQWQNRIGYVAQQIFLADDSIRRNIAFGVPDAAIDASAVERAARIANIHEFVLGLDAGYETAVGERGIRLSGGQLQRIGIARALYHDPDVLIMDEGTSALDGITEDSVMQAINRLSREKTVIIVAHRLTTVRHCDAIYVLEQGRVVEQGTYEELMKSSARFQRMANRVQAPKVIPPSVS